MKPVALIILMISGLYLGCIEKEKTDIMEEKTYTYLALGDSYTIGEGVEESGRYPNQAVEILKSKGLIFEKPTTIQQQAIPVALEGRDILASAPTGTASRPPHG